MAKADLRKTENVEDREETGRVIERTQQLSGLSLKEFSEAVKRDERQVSRWMNGSENPQIAAIRRTKKVRQAFLLAQAEAEVDGAEVETIVRLKRA